MSERGKSRAHPVSERDKCPSSPGTREGYPKT